MTNQSSAQHSVIIHFNYGIDSLDPLHQLGRKLDRIIKAKNVGEYDGHEIAMDSSHGFLYLYGPNAETLFKTVLPTLQATDFMTGASATLRFGPPTSDAKLIEVEIE